MEETLKVQPQNIEAEQSLLGSLLLDRDQIPIVFDILQSNHFYKEAHQILFDAITSLHQKSEPVDLVTLSNELQSKKKLEPSGGIGYITGLIESAPAPYNAKQYAKIIVEKSRLRSLIRYGKTVATEAYDQEKNLSDVLELAETKLKEILGNEEAAGIISIKEATRAAVKKIENQKAGVLNGFPSGFIDLDKLLGGFKDTDLIIVAARPSMGKTSLALNIAENAAVWNSTPLPVGIISLEMSSGQLATRMLCSVGAINSYSLQNGNLAEADWENMFNAAGQIAKAPINMTDLPGMNIREVRVQCRRLKSDHNVKAILIDYLQLIHGSAHNKGNRVNEITEISQELKMLARELKIPLIVLSQLSREVEKRHDKRPALSDLRDSGSIEQDADVVIFIYRDEYYKQKEAGKDHEKVTSDIAEINVAKNRNGPCGMVELLFQGGFTRFKNMETKYHG